MNLDDVRQKGRALSPWAHMATVGADGKPDVSPVHPCWDGDSGSPEVGFLAVTPSRALWLGGAVVGGSERWSA